jgi:hypothetical protein
MTASPLRSCLDWLVVGGLSLSLALAVGVAGGSHLPLDLVIPRIQLACDADQLTYRVRRWGQPMEAGIRCVQPAGMEPMRPGGGSWAHVFDWIGEDIVYGSRARHKGDAWLHPSRGSPLLGFVQTLSDDVSWSADDSVVLDIELVLGDWSRPKTLRVTGMWRKAWEFQEAL